MRIPVIAELGRRRPRPVGRCPACGRDVAERDERLRLHGVHFHRRCATYRVRRLGRG